MTHNVGVAQDLIQRMENSDRLLLVRAINDDELGELVKNSPAHHCFHVGTRYEKYYGNMIAKHARLRSGTVIVYTPQGDDFGSKKESKEMFELGEDWATCTKEFYGPVEVYNINGLNWEGIIEYLRRIS